MAHGIVRIDNMHGTLYGDDLATVVYEPSNTPTAIDNGNFVVIGNLKTGEREVCVGTTPAANSAKASIGLVASDEVMTDMKYDSLGDFYNKAGAKLRCYKMNGVFSLDSNAVAKADGITPTVGTTILELQAGTKGKMVNTPTASTTKLADLIAVETVDGVTFYVFRA